MLVEIPEIQCNSVKVANLDHPFLASTCSSEWSPRNCLSRQENFLCLLTLYENTDVEDPGDDDLPFSYTVPAVDRLPVGHHGEGLVLVLVGLLTPVL